MKAKGPNQHCHRSAVPARVQTAQTGVRGLAPYFVFIKRPVGDFMSAVPEAAVESSHITLSMPPSDATIMFRPGTPLAVVGAAAAHAVACGAAGARVELAEAPDEAD
jgi:hypothetical protein